MDNKRTWGLPRLLLATPHLIPICFTQVRYNLYIHHISHLSPNRNEVYVVPSSIALSSHVRFRRYNEL